MEQIIHLIVDTVSHLGYAGIVILMFIESSFVPFPSEVVMVPAGYLAYKGEMSVINVILCGLLGSLLGAWFNYYFSLYFGRAFLKRYGRYFFLPEEKLVHVENFFQKHGPFSTFVGRLIPMVRQLISVPAGLARMNIAKFSLYTGLGAGIWMVVLTLVGYFIGHQEELIKEYITNITLWVLAAIVLATALYVFYHKKKAKNSTK